MKRILLLLIFFIGYTPFYTQNLVPNPGFEEFNVCPPNTSINTWGIPRIKDYIKFWEDNDVSPIGSSSDFFHTCADIYNSNIGPATGNGHLGVFTYTRNSYREYVQVPLKTALCRGRTYRVKLKLASSRGARRNTDRIGVYFSNGRFTPPDAAAVPLTAQVETPARQFITNETRWREFTMTFTNTGGGEDHLTIGNFRNNANTNFVGSGSNASNAYIYIDDVSVEDITPDLTVAGGTVNNANCGNTDGSITGLSVSGGSGNYTYQWTDSNGVIVSTDLNPNGLTIGVYELIVDDGTCSELVDDTFIIEDDCPEPCPRTNLAPNPGFEEIKRCPNQRSLNRNDLGRNVRDWYSPNDGLPTLYNQCALGSAFMSGTPSPYPGQGFVGLYTYYYAAEYGDDRKEYVQAQLTSPLVAGESYTVQFDVRLRVARNYATDQMGVYFSNNAVTINGSDGELGVTPSLKTPAGAYFTDTNNWLTVTFSSPYIATGGEEYITIGKFEDVANTTFLDLVPGQGSAEAFYFIDNIVIEPESGATGAVDAGPDQTIDLGDTTSLNTIVSSGTPTYIWTASPADASLSGQENDQNPNVSPTETTTYTVTADFGGGCISTDEVLITVTNPPCTASINAGPNQTINDTQTAQLQAMPSGGTPINYTWSPTTGLNDPNISNPVFTPPTGAGTYTFTVEADFGNGCVDTDTVTITVNASCTHTVDAGSDQTINSGDTATLNTTPSTGTPAYTWIANPADPSLTGQENTQNPTVSPLQTTTYTVTADFGIGCIDTDMVIINVDVQSCTGPNLVVNHSFENFSECRSGINLGGECTSSQPDTFCFMDDWSNASQATPDWSSTCNGTNPPLTADSQTKSPQDGETFVGFIRQYTISSDFHYGEYVTSRLASPLVAGQAYQVSFYTSLSLSRPYATYVGAYFSTNPVSQTNRNPIDVVPQIESNERIEQRTGWVLVKGTFIAAGGEEYITLGSFGLDRTIPEPIMNIPGTPDQKGSYYYLDNIEVVALNSGFVDAGPDQTINLGEFATIFATPSTGTPTYTWTASPADPSLLGQENVQNLTVSPLQTTTYTVTADFGGGCINTDQVTVFVNISCTILLNETSIISTNPDCGQTNGSITGITVTGNSGSETYSWTNASGTEVGTSMDLSAIGQGDYTLTVTDGSCSDIAGPFTINENGGPVLDVSNIVINNADCGRTNGSITGITVTGNSGNETYSWTDTNGNQIANTIDLIGVGPENYLLTVAQGACTTTSGPYTLTENNAPILDDSDIQINNADCDQTNGSITGIIITNPSGNETYSWTDTSGTQVGTDINLIGRGPGSYSLNLEVGACVATIGPFSINELNDCEDPTTPNIRIANALTPNGDGSNDMFMIRGLENYPNNRLYIFNRWGNKVYEASNYQNDWYGNYQGRPLPVATYYYILELNDSNRKIYKGAITIIR